MEDDAVVELRARQFLDPGDVGGCEVRHQRDDDRPVRGFEDQRVFRVFDIGHGDVLSGYLASAATCILTMRSGFSGGSPRFRASTNCMPSTTSPQTVYWLLR